MADVMVLDEVMGDAVVRLGDLDINSALPDGGPLPGDAFGFEVLSDGFDPGSLDAVRVTQASFELDGDHEYITRYGSKTRIMQVRVTGVTGGALNDAGAVLTRAANAATELTFRMPEDDLDSVYDVCNVVVDEVWDDDAYMFFRQRVYKLTIKHLPFARSSEKVTVTFSSGAGGVGALDPGASTTNWQPVTGSPAPVASTYEGSAAIKFDTGLYSNEFGWPGKIIGVDYIGAIAGSPDFLVLDWASETGGPQPRMGATYDTGDLPTATMPSPLGPRYARSVFAYTTGVPRFWLVGGYSDPATHNPVRLWIGRLGKTAALPAGALYNIPTPGSMRTFASLKVYKTDGSHITQDVAAYSDPSMGTHNWQPNVPASWANAPAGGYVAFIPNVSPAGVGDSISLTFTATATGKTQTMSTTIDPSAEQAVLGTPFGVFDLGGTRDGRIGAGTWSVSGGISLTNNLVIVRVTDAATGFGGSLGGFGDTDEAKLTAVKTYASLDALYFDPPSGPQPQGGVWGVVGDETRDVGDSLTWWSWHAYTPPVTVLWVPVGDPFASPSNISLDIELYPRYGHYASKRV